MLLSFKFSCLEELITTFDLQTHCQYKYNNL